MTKCNVFILGALSLVLLAIPIATTAADVSGAPSLVKLAYPTLTTGALASARLAELPQDTILKSGQMKITQKDLNAEIAKAPEAIRPQLKRNLFFVLEKEATRMLLEYEAAGQTEQIGIRW